MRPGRFVWGLIIIILGVLLLAASLGWISWGFILSLVQLWPVILVLVGIQILLGRSRPTLAAILMGVVLIATVGVAWGLWGTSLGTTHQRTIAGPSAAGITQATANIDVAATRLTLTGADMDSVVSGTFRGRGDIRFDQSGSGGAYRLDIQPEGRAWIAPGIGGGANDEGIRLTVNSRVPWSIIVNGGAASMELDLTRVTLQELQVNSGASSARVIVGENIAPGARLDIAGGVGSYRISFPRGLTVNVSSETGLTSIRAEGFQSQGNGGFVHQGGGPSIQVSVKAGVSSVRLDLY